MSLFGNKRQDEVEAARQMAIKLTLSKEVASSIKKLQRDHISTDSAIRSGDTANRFCNVMEAILLHELKDSYSSKTFWPFLIKFTHRDVMEQIKTLSFIKTEIGFCRAWVRLALNDCLMESYFAAILRDSKAIKQYYSRNSFLRDAEQPFIIKNYLQGLSNFSFQLSYNSNLLNVWGAAPSMLKGSWSPPNEQSREGIASRTSSDSNYPSSDWPVTSGALTQADMGFQITPSSSVDTPERLNSYHESELSTNLLQSLAEEEGSKGDPEVIIEDSTDFEDSVVIHLSPSGGSSSTRSPALEKKSNPSSPSPGRPTNLGVSKHPDLDDSATHSEESTNARLSELSNEYLKPSNPFGDKDFGMDDGDDGFGSDALATVMPQQLDKRSPEPSPFYGGSEGVQNDPTSFYGGTQSDSAPFFVQRAEGTPLERSLEENDDLNPFQDDAAQDADPSTQSAKKPRIPSLQEELQAAGAGSQFIPEFDSDAADRHDNRSDDVKHQRKRREDAGGSHGRKADVDHRKGKRNDEAHQHNIRQSDAGRHGNRDVHDVDAAIAGKDTLDGEEKEELHGAKELAKNGRLSIGRTSNQRDGQLTRSNEGVGNGRRDCESQENGDRHRQHGRGEKEEEFTSSYGNSLGPFRGWSSEFPHHKAAAMAADDVTDGYARQESYQSLLKNYMDTTEKASAPVSDLSPLTSASSERAAEGQPAVPQTKSPPTSPMPNDLGLDFEIIPFSSSPASEHADMRTQELLRKVTEIANEKGLDSQNYQCKGCTRPVGIIYGKAKVCGYDGSYYCYECHVDEESIIPARILYSWDFRKQKVARHTKSFLQQIEAMPLVDIVKDNPSLYKAVPELEEVKKIRMQLKYLKAYLFTCKQSVAEELKKRVWPRHYMLDHVHLYSMLDFSQVQAGTLSPILKKVVVFAVKHVQGCALCSQKGFICEICENSKIIYPFDMDFTIQCERCKAVYHRACKTELKPCPKCSRRKLRKNQTDSPTSQETNFVSPFT